MYFARQTLPSFPYMEPAPNDADSALNDAEPALNDAETRSQ